MVVLKRPEDNQHHQNTARYNEQISWAVTCFSEERLVPSTKGHCNVIRKGGLRQSGVLLLSLAFPLYWGVDELTSVPVLQSPTEPRAGHLRSVSVDLPDRIVRLPGQSHPTSRPEVARAACEVRSRQVFVMALSFTNSFSRSW